MVFLNLTSSLLNRPLTAYGAGKIGSKEKIAIANRVSKIPAETEIELS
jgi:hypothetical protein